MYSRIHDCAAAGNIPGVSAELDRAATIEEVGSERSGITQLVVLLSGTSSCVGAHDTETGSCDWEDTDMGNAVAAVLGGGHMKVWIAMGLALLAETAHAAEPVMVGSDVPGVAVTSLSYCPDCGKHEVGVDLGDVAVRSPHVQALVTACGAVGKLYVRGRGSRAIGCRLQPTAPGVLSGPMPVLSMAKAPLGEFVTLSVRPFGRPRFAVAPVSASEMATLRPVFAAWMRKFNKQNQLTDEAALRAPAATDKAPMRRIEVADDEWFVLTAVYTGMESDGGPGPGSHSVVFHRFGKHLRVVGDFIGQVVSVGEVTGDGLPSLEVDDEIGQTHSWLRLLPHLQEIMGWENPND